MCLQCTVSTCVCTCAPYILQALHHIWCRAHSAGSTVQGVLAFCWSPRLLRVCVLGHVFSLPRNAFSVYFLKHRSEGSGAVRALLFQPPCSGLPFPAPSGASGDRGQGTGGAQALLSPLLLLTSSCCSPPPVAHLLLLLTSSCCSPPPVAHLLLLLTSSCCSPPPVAHLLLLLTSSCCSPPPVAHLLLLLTSSCCSGLPLLLVLLLPCV